KLLLGPRAQTEQEFGKIVVVEHALAVTARQDLGIAADGESDRALHGAAGLANADADRRAGPRWVERRAVRLLDLKQFGHGILSKIAPSNVEGFAAAAAAFFVGVAEGETRLQLVLDVI